MISCRRCRIGRFELIYTPYVWRTGDKTSIIPGAPALCCDFCGEMHYDQAFVYSLHLFADHRQESSDFEPIKMGSFDLVAWSNTRRKASGDS